MKHKKVTAVILSGGIGTRIGSDIPKQYIKVKDQAIITYSLRVFADHPDIDGVLIVAADEWRGFINDEMLKCGISTDKFIGFANPGENRQLSVYNALKAIISRPETDNSIEVLVMIHDAARPNISDSLISRLLEAYDGHDGVMPAESMKNTLYTSVDGKSLSGTLDRSMIFAGHTPELFDVSKYYQANISLLPDKIKSIKGSSEPALMAGMDIVMVENDEKNYKITTQNDLYKFSEEITRGCKVDKFTM
ncbi:MAG: 2-C-methyl-D-erythritol 4-phosphate cytidylyltransferase [Lachnospiraceae bacterium]|nr:2-C-methyl-D-erythritol 4-phosphate cytidylyltransferase [Lachnospiraceae bacterium]